MTGKRLWRKNPNDKKRSEKKVDKNSQGTR